MVAAPPDSTRASSFAPRRNTWASAALGCSVVVFCPPLTLLGPLLAIKALHEIKHGRQRAGRTLALMALVIGLAASATWAWGGYVWHTTIRRPLIEGPMDPLQAGLSGDLDGFRAGFWGDGAQASDEEIQRFLATLSARYGLPRGFRQREDAGGDFQGYQLNGYRIPYVIEFETGPINAEARFVIRAPDHSGWVRRFEWLLILDPDQGDLIFPAAATPPPR